MPASSTWNTCRKTRSSRTGATVHRCSTRKPSGRALPGTWITTGFPTTAISSTLRRRCGRSRSATCSRTPTSPTPARLRKAATPCRRGYSASRPCRTRSRRSCRRTIACRSSTSARAGTTSAACWTARWAPSTCPSAMKAWSRARAPARARASPRRSSHPGGSSRPRRGCATSATTSSASPQVRRPGRTPRSPGSAPTAGSSSSATRAGSART